MSRTVALHFLLFCALEALLKPLFHITPAESRVAVPWLVCVGKKQIFDPFVALDLIDSFEVCAFVLKAATVFIYTCALESVTRDQRAAYKVEDTDRVVCVTGQGIRDKVCGKDTGLANYIDARMKLQTIRKSI